MTLVLGDAKPLTPIFQRIMPQTRSNHRSAIAEGNIVFKAVKGKGQAGEKNLGFSLQLLNAVSENFENIVIASTNGTFILLSTDARGFKI